MSTFAAQSGLQLSIGKSKLFVSPNISNRAKQSLSQASGIPLTASLGNYLGVPIKHGRLTKDCYQAVIDRLQAKLALWKKNTLSFAGRRILVQSVTSMMANHVMQSQLLPVSIKDRIDRINRDFLWGDSENGRKPHLINWRYVCTSKDRED